MVALFPVELSYLCAKEGIWAMAGPENTHRIQGVPIWKLKEHYLAS